MKIAITGHTKGIGKAIVERLQFKAEFVGYTRSGGQNIRDASTVGKLIVDSGADVFINNAHLGFNQVALLHEVFAQWKNLPKLIINISSDSADGIKAHEHIYATEKAALNHAALQLSSLQSKCRVTTLRLGYVDTTRVAHVQGVPKLSPDKVAETVAWIMSQPDRVLIRDLTLQPR